MSDSTQHDFDLDPRTHGGVKGITISVRETPRQPTADEETRWEMARALLGDKAFAELLQRADAEHKALARPAAQPAPAPAKHGNIIISVAGAAPAAAAKAKAAIKEGIDRALERPHSRPSGRMDDATPPRPGAKLTQGDPWDV